MEFHPIAEIFPLLESDELERLAADIKANGLHHSLWTYEGKILDGRNRWLACQIAGVEPRVRKYEGASPFAFVVSENLERRHLSVTQRVAMAVEGLPMLEAEARGRQEATRAKPGEKIGTNVVPKLEPRSKARDQAGAAPSGRDADFGPRDPNLRFRPPRGPQGRAAARRASSWA